MLRSREGLRPAFGHSDLIICILVMATAVGLLLPLLNRQKVRGPSYRTQTNNNLKQIALAVHSYNDNFRRLPPAFDKQEPGVAVPVSIHVHLLPYIEQDHLYRKYLAEAGVGATRMAIVPPFLSPADQTVWGNGEGVQNFTANLRTFSDKGAKTKYNAAMVPLAIVEPGPAFGINRIADGTSNTIFFATKYANCGEGGSYYAAEPSSKWAAFFGQNAALTTADPADATATFQLSPGRRQCLHTPLMAQSFGTSGLSVGLADGSVRMIHPAMSAETWNRVMQPNDGQAPGSDWNN